MSAELLQNAHHTQASPDKKACEDDVLDRGVLNPSQRVAALVLGHGGTADEAARAAGCHPQTVYKWNRHPEFRQAVEDEARAQLDGLRSGLVDLALNGTRVIRHLMDDDRTPAHVRLKAATSALRLLSSVPGEPRSLTRRERAEMVAEVIEIVHRVGSRGELEAARQAAEDAVVLEDAERSYAEWQQISAELDGFLGRGAA